MKILGLLALVVGRPQIPKGGVESLWSCCDDVVSLLVWALGLFVLGYVDRDNECIMKKFESMTFCHTVQF